MITFEQAQAIVAAELLPDWNSNLATFHVADWGWQTDEYWMVPAGPREWLVEFEIGFMILDDEMYLVDKKTGEFIKTVAYRNTDLLRRMEPYGEIPQNFQ